MHILFSLISKVTVYCDSRLKDTFIQYGEEAGATGHTWFDCHGKGRRELIPDPYSGADRVGIIFLCNEATADKIVEGCLKYRGQGVTVYKEKVQVPQGDALKFRSTEV